MATRNTATGRYETPRLTDAQLGELMRLIKGADTVELKVTVPADAHRATIRGLGIDPVEAQLRQVYFFDTPDLALDKAGLVVRARRIQGGRADTVVKVRPVDPDHLPPELRKDASFNVEVDALPGGFVCSASFKGRATSDEVRDAVGGKLPLRRLFSKGQRAFFASHAPSGIELDTLVPLGPTFVLKTRVPIQLGVGKSTVRQLVGEVWLYPDGSRILELSTKCAPSETFQVAAETRAYLAERKIDLGGNQQTKTRAALDFHVRHLAAAEPAALDDGTEPAAKRRTRTRAKAAAPADGSTAEAATTQPATS
jgi:hypothetical protein